MTFTGKNGAKLQQKTNQAVINDAMHTTLPRC